MALLYDCSPDGNGETGLGNLGANSVFDNLAADSVCEGDSDPSSSTITSGQHLLRCQQILAVFSFCLLYNLHQFICIVYWPFCCERAGLIESQDSPSRALDTTHANVAYPNAISDVVDKDQDADFDVTSDGVCATPFTLFNILRCLP